MLPGCAMTVNHQPLGRDLPVVAAAAGSAATPDVGTVGNHFVTTVTREKPMRAPAAIDVGEGQANKPTEAKADHIDSDLAQRGCFRRIYSVVYKGRRKKKYKSVAAATIFNRVVVGIAANLFYIALFLLIVAPGLL